MAFCYSLDFTSASMLLPLLQMLWNLVFPFVRLCLSDCLLPFFFLLLVLVFRPRAAHKLLSLLLNIFTFIVTTSFNFFLVTLIVDMTHTGDSSIIQLALLTNF